MWSAGLTVMYMFTGKEFGQLLIEQAKARHMPHPMPLITAAQRELQGTHYSIQRLLQEQFCSSVSHYCERSGLFDHALQVPMDKGRSSETMPVVIAILSKVFRPLQRSDYRSNRWDAKAVLNTFFGVGSGVVPRLSKELQTMEKKIPVQHAMHGLMRGGLMPGMAHPKMPMPVWAMMPTPGMANPTMPMPMRAPPIRSIQPGSTRRVGMRPLSGVVLIGGGVHGRV